MYVYQEISLTVYRDAGRLAGTLRGDVLGDAGIVRLVREFRLADEQVALVRDEERVGARLARVQRHAVPEPVDARWW